MAAQGSGSGKVDMSLDDNIKMETTAPKKRRSKPRKRRRIAASMIRPRAVSRASRASRFRQSASRRFVPPAAAMAVLRRARETAVAAAQAAADAAALIERSRAQRQDFFDEQRGITGPETSDKIGKLIFACFLTSYTRSRRRRRRRLATTAQTTANGREGATMRPDAPRGRTYRRRNAAYWGRRRERRKLRQAQERTAASIYDPYGDRPLPEPYPFEPEPYSNMLDEYPAMVDYEGYDWPHSVQGDFHSLYGPAFADPIERVPVPANVRYGRSRNDEYLAQARALIQAQNEHLNPGFRPSYESRHYPTPNSRGTSWDSRPQWSHRW
ncbi:hypothetical protein PHET_03664 [Paragonimus heterotremus]|uniref:Uncharacterized protein n=1 Tax=Paragonimus heterotremus TaxID=100268 RepID=A0A8J4WJS4_9TREM|nr:hypothetical protein PHET_03664 [Paragonimus heterotremus]